MNKILRKFKEKGLKILIITLVSGAVVFGISNFAHAATPTELYDEVWKIVYKKYVDQTNNGQDWYKWRHKYDDKIKTSADAYIAIETMLASLNDPYTRFLDPKEFAEENSSIKGSLKGIGIQIGMRDGKLMVIAPIEDSPAEKAGILSDDEILEINSESVKGMKIDVAADKIRGEAGTTVNLLVKRGSEQVRFIVVRDEIEIKSVSTKPPIEVTIPENIQYIRLSSFISKKAYEEFTSILNKSRSKKGYIIDLRSNPGGLLSNAMLISDLFLPGGIIVSTVDRDGYKDTTRATAAYNTKKPIVILINKGSASASEIFSGAMQDNRRAVIVGEQSFGKGLVQEINKLSNEAGLNITIQKYLTPCGTDINKKGITPDIVVELTEEDIKNKNDVQLKKAISVLQAME